MKTKSAFIFSLFIFLLLVCHVPAFSEPLSEVVIVEDTLTIDLAESNVGYLNAYVLPENEEQSLNWYSSRNSTLSVKDGMLTAHRTGVVTITANIPQNGKIKDQCTVTIIDSRIPVSVTVSGESNTVEPTETISLLASVEPAKAPQEVIWESLNKSVATVDQNGIVTAKREGTVYIRAYAKDNISVRGQMRLTVRYKEAPEEIRLPFSEYRLYVGEEYRLVPSILPGEASQLVTFSSSDESIARVDAEGNISALAYGHCTISVKSMADPAVYAKVVLTVSDHRIPDVLIAHPSFLRLEPSNFQDVSLLILPEREKVDLLWSTNNENVAVVDQDGRVTAVGEGECTITCVSAYTSQISARIPVTVEYGKDISALTLSVQEITIPRGETASVIIEKTPLDAGNAIAFSYSNPGICEMNETGSIKALRRGETIVRLYSYKNPEIFSEIMVTVEDDLSPLSAVSDTSSSILLMPGGTAAPQVSFLPETASQAFTWKCSNPEIAFVDENGVIKAVSPGVSVIEAVNRHANEITFEFFVTVEAEEYTLVMPERRTDIASIENNLQKIENVQKSAQKMLLKDYEDGKMPKKEYTRRKEIIDNAFEMYAFPWMVETVQKYWSDENSENGLKDFKPGIVYYGLPYVSGGSSDRTYTVERATQNQWYLPSDDGNYYIFNRNHPSYDGMYVGNDCSAFISLAYFGNAVHNGEKIKTYTLYYDERFITTDDPENLRAGDIMIRHSIHVIMFLYWADEAHTQAVFIEQGGSEPGINTISTSVYTVSDYFDNFYHVRTPFYR